jgi:hypothetical protein
MRTKLPTPTNRAGILIFESAQRRRSGARLRILERTYRDAVENQARVASRLEEVLTELEQSSLQAEEAAWALSSAQQCRTSCMSFGEVMEWLAEICRLRNAGEHFCIAELVRSAAVPEPRERTV